MRKGAEWPGALPNSLLSQDLQVQLRSVLGAGNDSEHE